MIKPWKDRVEEAAHFREEDYINDVQYFMQAEIDELRTENARLKAALLTNDTTIESANNAAGMLEAENARLRSALVGLIGADNEQELRQMEATMRLLPAPEEDKAVSINAIHALLATLPVNAGDKPPQVGLD